MRFFSRASVEGGSPDGFEVCGKRSERRRIYDCSGRSGVMSGDLTFGLRNTRECRVPARLQFARHQPVGRIGGVILPEGAVGRIARRFEIAFQGIAHLIPPLDHFLLRGDGGGDGAGVRRWAAGSIVRRFSR